MDNIHISDFCYMWQGKKQKPLDAQDAHVLAPAQLIHTTSQKRVLLLLHGFGSSPAVYRLMLPLITKYDAIICPALPGHASNLSAFSTVTATDWLEAVRTITQDLLEQYQHVDILGLSLGGLLAYHLAEKYPIHHLYLLNPALLLRPSFRFTKRAAHCLHALGLSRIPNRGGNILSPEHAELGYRQLPLHAIIELFSFIEKTIIKPIDCPVDVFLGRKDAVVDVERVAKSLFTGPHTHIHWLEHSAHVLPLDADRQLIVDQINKT